MKTADAQSAVYLHKHGPEAAWHVIKIGSWGDAMDRTCQCLTAWPAFRMRFQERAVLHDCWKALCIKQTQHRVATERDQADSKSSNASGLSPFVAASIGSEQHSKPRGRNLAVQTAKKILRLQQGRRLAQMSIWSHPQAQAG